MAAEELTRNKNVGEAVKAVIKSAPTDGSYQEEDPISGAQIKAIESRCSTLNIDVMKFVNSYENGKKYNKLEDIRKKTAIPMIGLLNEYQQNKREVPEEIRGKK